MQVNGNGEFCAGCIMKGNFCGPLEPETPIVKGVPGYGGRETGVGVAFQDPDGMASEQFRIPAGEIETAEGPIMNEKDHDIRNVYPGTPLGLTGTSRAVKDKLVERVKRCSGNGSRLLAGQPKAVVVPTCPAINADVIADLRGKVLQQKASYSPEQ